MSVELTHDLWQELKRYISVVDRDEAADIVVNILIDNDVDANDIRSAFAGDKDIKSALSNYIDNDVEELESEDDDIEDWDA